MTFTAGELRVLPHLALGLSNKQIAAATGLSIYGTKDTVHRILGKLQVENRAQAALKLSASPVVGLLPDGAQGSGDVLEPRSEVVGDGPAAGQVVAH